MTHRNTPWRPVQYFSHRTRKIVRQLGATGAQHLTSRFEFLQANSGSAQPWDDGSAIEQDLIGVLRKHHDGAPPVGSAQGLKPSHPSKRMGVELLDLIDIAPVLNTAQLRIRSLQINGLAKEQPIICND